MVKKTETQTEILNVGLVGHIDHGKTTLLEKLSGKWTDTHSEEIKRGITVRLGYADIEIYKDKDFNIENKGKFVRKISFIDAPGHEMLMATMLAGAALIDAAILVIAANEGIKPQTKEHLLALKAKGIKNLIVVQNKIDLVDVDKAKNNYKEIINLIKDKFENVPIIPVSAQQKVNVEKIWQALTEIDMTKRDLDSPPLFLVARSFDINKPGTIPENLHGAVLGGTLKRGRLKIGEEIEIKPGRIIKEANKLRYETIKTKIISLFRAGQKVDEIIPGGSVAIETELDIAAGKGDSLAGNVASSKNNLPELSEKIKIKYSLFDKNTKPINPSEILMLSIGTSITGGPVSSIKGDTIEITLRKPTITFQNEIIGITRNIESHWKLIGSGIVQ